MVFSRLLLEGEDWNILVGVVVPAPARTIVPSVVVVTYVSEYISAVFLLAVGSSCLPCELVPLPVVSQPFPDMFECVCGLDDLLWRGLDDSLNLKSPKF